VGGMDRISYQALVANSRRVAISMPLTCPPCDYETWKYMRLRRQCGMPGAREWMASPQRLRGVARHIAVIASTSNVPEPTITPAKPNIRASY